MLISLLARADARGAETSTSTAAEQSVDDRSINSEDTVNTAKPTTQADGERGIAQSQLQPGVAEKNVAKLLHQAGLAEHLMQGEDFHIKAENEPYTPLSIERHDQTLYLTHFLEGSAGNLFIDSELVFHISQQGQLSLIETATQNPFTGGEYRSCDREFANIFSKNLLDQGFAAAAFRTRQAQPQSQQTTPSVADNRASQPLQSIPSLADDRTSQSVPSTLSTTDNCTSQPALTAPSTPDEPVLPPLPNTSSVADDRVADNCVSQPVPSTPSAVAEFAPQPVPTTSSVASDCSKQPASSTSPTASDRSKQASSKPSTTKTSSKPSSSSKTASASPPAATSTQSREKEPVDAHQQLSLFDPASNPSAAVKQLS